jgi:tRNA(Ile)-lysidine synthase
VTRTPGQSRPQREGSLVAAVENAVRAALGSGAPVVLAVSGGRDSMALLDAAGRVVPDRVRLVATFDHGSGAHAAEGVAVVRAAAARLGLPVVAGRGAPGPATEASWRASRWTFLSATAAAAGGAAIATAHTEDDQLETVFMRALRGAGARGLAGLYAAGPVVRPFLELPRATIAAYAASRGVPFHDDPTNRSRRHLRNRVRLDLLPAAVRARPGFAAELLALARRAAQWRTRVEALAAALGEVDATRGELRVPVGALAGLTERELAVLWPALAARVGVTLDRRGTTRLAGFTTGSRSGARMPLSGGASASRQRELFVLRRGRVDISPTVEMEECDRREGATVRCGAFRFAVTRFTGGARAALPVDAWAAEFDAAATLTVRSWVPGDRMSTLAGGAARRVKRFFADARVPAEERRVWPVVLADGVIAWIPGVRRSDAATVRPGRPGVRYDCDRNDG